MEEEQPTIYEQLGGQTVFFRLAEVFYQRVEKEPVLRSLYPESLDEAQEHLALFLVQFFGGPETYSEQRGHPRLRARHLSFVIGQKERDTWVKHMLDSIDEVGVKEPAREELRRYFQQAATFLMNSYEDDSPDSLPTTR